MLHRPSRRHSCCCGSFTWTDAGLNPTSCFKSVTRGTPGHAPAAGSRTALLPNLYVPVSVGNQLVGKQEICKPMSKTSKQSSQVKRASSTRRFPSYSKGVKSHCQLHRETTDTPSPSYPLHNKLSGKAAGCSTTALAISNSSVTLRAGTRTE